jgi:hypothetical protein
MNAPIESTAVADWLATQVEAGGLSPSLAASELGTIAAILLAQPKEKARLRRNAREPKEAARVRPTDQSAVY